jgi:hypothetical protein
MLPCGAFEEPLRSQGIDLCARFVRDECAAELRRRCGNRNLDAVLAGNLSQVAEMR